MNQTKEITVRANGKAHPAIEFSNGTFMVTCSCPGSKNGSLNKGRKIAEGHAAANCRIK